jgi:hypothetical protein
MPHSGEVDIRRALACASAERAHRIEESDVYLVLDSHRKLQSSDLGRGTFRWHLMVQGATGDDVIGTSDTLDNIVQVQISAFAMPTPPEVPYVLTAPEAGSGRLTLVQNNDRPAAEAPTLVAVGRGIYSDTGPSGYGQYPTAAFAMPRNNSTNPAEPLNPADVAVIYPWINNPYSQVAHGNRMTIQIHEAGSQAYSDRSGGRHHFEFIVAHSGGCGTNPNMLAAAPNPSDGGVFSFGVPLLDLTRLTLTFRGPDHPIRFDPDVYYGAPAVLNGGTIDGPFLGFRLPGPPLNIGDRVYFEDFASGIPELDRHINRPEGHVASRLPGAAGFTPRPGLPLALNPDGETYDLYTDPGIGFGAFLEEPVVGGWAATVYIAKRRLRLSARFRRRAPGRRAKDPRMGWNRE